MPELTGFRSAQCLPLKQLANHPTDEQYPEDSDDPHREHDAHFQPSATQLGVLIQSQEKILWWMMRT